jgi:hypothetical protein
LLRWFSKAVSGSDAFGSYYTPQTLPSSSTHKGAIIGGVVGGVALLSAIVAALIYAMKKQKGPFRKGVFVINR